MHTAGVYIRRRKLHGKRQFCDSQRRSHKVSQHLISQKKNFRACKTAIAEFQVIELLNCLGGCNTLKNDFPGLLSQKRMFSWACLQGFGSSRGCAFKAFHCYQLFARCSLSALCSLSFIVVGLVINRTSFRDPQKSQEVDQDDQR